VRSYRWTAAPLVAALAVMPLALQWAIPAAATVAPQAPSLRQCQTIGIPVALAPGDPASEQISAEYCLPFGRHVSTVDVLVPGATYNHTYWDWPVDPSLYSYADKTLAAGRAVLAVDRIGTGTSSHPLSTEITLQVEIYTIHQVIAWARQTARFGQVDLIGHSIGSVIAAGDASEWPQDVNRLVLTSIAHAITADEQTFESDVYPANQDPLFADSGLDSGYLTTLPGDRAQLFYYHGNPSVIAYDEAHKDVVSATSVNQAISWFIDSTSGSPSTANITAPVLVVLGQDDFLFCQSAGAPDCASPAAVRANEAPYYPGAASLTTETVPGTGHDVALSPTADLSFAMINAWIGTHG
jgi:pimeloyl-ACP methyl ester carboxylesterase